MENGRYEGNDGRKLEGMDISMGGKDYTGRLKRKNKKKATEALKLHV